MKEDQKITFQKQKDNTQAEQKLIKFLTFNDLKELNNKTQNQNTNVKNYSNLNRENCQINKNNFRKYYTLQQNQERNQSNCTIENQLDLLKQQQNNRFPISNENKHQKAENDATNCLKDNTFSENFEKKYKAKNSLEQQHQMKQSALLLEKQLFACTLLEIIKLEKNIKTQSNYNIEYIPDIVNPSFSKAILDKKKHQKKQRKENRSKKINHKYYKLLIIMVNLINIVAYCIYDYTDISNTKIMNNISVYIQITCNIIFTIEAIYQIRNQGFLNYFKDMHFLFDFINISCGFLIYVNQLPADLKLIFKSIQLIRTFRVIYYIDYIYLQYKKFAKSLPSLLFPFISLLAIIIFFSILGLNIFSGSFEYRCRVSSNPLSLHHHWEVAHEIPFLCGSWKCPHETYCRSPLQYDLDFYEEELHNEILNFGYTRFDNIFYSFFTIFHIIRMISWGNIIFMYWRYLNSILVFMYFIPLCFLCFYIMINIILGILYDSFQEFHGIQDYQEFKIKEQEKAQANKLKHINDIKQLGKQFLKQQQKTQLTKQNELENKRRKKSEQIQQKQKKNSQFFNFFSFTDLNSKKLETVLHSRILQFLINSYITINLVTILLYCYDSSEESEYFYDQIETYLIWFFLAEVLLKMVLLRKQYFKSKLNQIDIVILVLNILIQITPDIMNKYHEFSPLIKSIYVFRIFQLIYNIKYFEKLCQMIEYFIISAKEVLNYICLIFLYVLTFSLIGTQLFADKCKFIGEKVTLDQNLGQSPRFNFDNLINSFQSVFYIILNEEWHLNMYNYMRCIGDYVCIYWIITIITGEILLMKLFLALFINTYINHLKDENKQTGINLQISEIIQKEDFQQKSQFRKAKVSIKNNQIYVEIKCLCQKLIKSSIFKYVLIVSIIINAIIVALDFPLKREQNNIKIVSYYIDWILIMIFQFEIIVKLIAIDKQQNKKFYLIDKFIIFDLFCLGISITYQINQQQTIINCLRGFRILQLIKYFECLSLIIKSLVKSVPVLFKLIIFAFLFIIITAIFPMRYFQHKMHYCSGAEKISHFHFLIKSKQDCLDLGLDWVKRDIHWDNILYSCFNLFAIASSEGWSLIVWEAQDAYKQDMQPIYNYNAQWSFFFSFYFFVANLMIFNAFIGIMIESFNLINNNYLKQEEVVPLKCKKINPSDNVGQENIQSQSKQEEEWVQIKKLIYKINLQKQFVLPDENKEKIRYVIYQTLITNNRLENFMFIIIMLYAILLSINFHRQNIEYASMLEICSDIFFSIFFIEILIKVYVYKLYFFNKYFNIFELILIIILIVSRVLYILNGDVYDEISEIRIVMKILQVFRCLRLVYCFKMLQNLFNIIIDIIPQILPIFILILFLLHIYAKIGMAMFPYLKLQKYINGYDMHFQNYSSSLFSLIKVATSELWFQLVQDTTRQQQPNFTCNYIQNYEQYLKLGLTGCGTKWAYLYFFSFHFLNTVILINLFVAVFIENVIKYHKAIDKYQIEKIKHLWLQYDQNAFGFIQYSDFQEFTFKMLLIYGVSVKKFPNFNNSLKFLQFINVPLYLNKQNGVLGYRFYDVVVRLTQVSLFLKYGVIPGENRESKEIIQQFYKELDEKNKFDVIETVLTSGSMAAIIMFQRKSKIAIQRRKDLKNDDILAGQNVQITHNIITLGSIQNKSDILDSICFSENKKDINFNTIYNKQVKSQQNQFKK